MFDNSIKCPFCQYQASLDSFFKLDQDGQRRFTGKSAERFIMLRCPECGQEIKWDTPEDVFLKPDQKVKSRLPFFLIGFVVTVLIIIGIIWFTVY